MTKKTPRALPVYLLIKKKIYYNPFRLESES